MSATAFDHTYAYEGASGLAGQHLSLVTSGGAAPHPFFFEGDLTAPRATAQALRALTRVVGARFFTPPSMLQRILAHADPVVTSERGMLRFEGFSACASTYVRVDLTPDAIAGDVAGFGTTNVDFNAPMRAALASVRDGERLALSVGRSALVLAHERGQVVERKVPLPLRWLKGFVEVQAYLERLTPFAELAGVDAMRFLRGLPRASTSKHRMYVVPHGRTLRLAMQATPGAVATTGLERLRALEDLAPGARTLRVYGDANGQASAWELDLGPLRVTLALSAEVWRGFSGEGQALVALARREALAMLVATLRAQLAWQARLEPAALAEATGASEADVHAAVRILGARGLVGFDQREARFYHRELPFDLERLEALSPRLEAARALVDGGAVAHEGATWRVRSGDVEHQVTLDAEDEPARCTCTWFAKHRLERGPCKHMLAAQLAAEAETP